MINLDDDSSCHCIICTEDVERDQWFTLRCGHGFCQDCLLQHVQVSVDQNGTLPACPHTVNDCQHRVDETEFEECVARSQILTQNGRPAGDVKIDPVRTLDRLRLLEQRAGLNDAGAFPCISCSEWMVPSTPGSMEHVACPSCAESFCAKCRRRPFHYNCTCEELDEIYTMWQAWAKGHGVVLHDLEQRIKENSDMEKWKQKKCRHCPKCKRVIERTGGCEQMVCGRNTEGKKKNIQDGCGHKFNWAKAERYKGDASNKELSALAKDALKLPDGFTAKATSARWPVSDELDAFERCEVCGDEIVGPKFDCVHCPSLVVCSSCVHHVTTRETSASNVKTKESSRAKLKIKSKPAAAAKFKVTAKANAKAHAGKKAHAVASESEPSKSVVALARVTELGHRQDHVFRIRWRNPGPNECQGVSKGTKRSLSGQEHDVLEQLSPRELDHLLREQLEEWGQTLPEMKEQLRMAGVNLTGSKQKQLMTILQALGTTSGSSSFPSVSSASSRS